MKQSTITFSITFIVGLAMSIFTDVTTNGLILYLLFVIYWEQLKASQLRGDK